MSKYTTGEIAKLCGVSVRTVQYYDNRGILIPCELSEGGRRLYSEEDLQQMKIICFLRNLGLSLDTISEILKEENSGEVVSELLRQQAQTLEKEISERKERLNILNRMLEDSRSIDDFSAKTIGDMAVIMEKKKSMKKVYGTMLFWGIPADILQILTLLYWIFRKQWQPFAIVMVISAVLAALLTRMYYRKAAYICPHCHEVFRPGFREFMFANHTPKTRKLTCSACGYHGFCIETAREEQ